MCTVTYIPTGEGEFLFTSNRDETPKRRAVGLVSEKRGERKLLFPRDPLVHGSWIIASDSNQLVCVLNGAFQKHHHRPPYRLSRGIMALEFFDYPDAPTFFDTYNFSGIEPFTLVIYDNGNLYELRWDEQQQHVTALDPSQRHLWASCTLYSDDWLAKRNQWFAEWGKKHPQFDQVAVLDFHKHAGEGNPEYDLVMNRHNIVRTTSITSVVKNKTATHIRYEDLLGGEVNNGELALLKTV